MKLIKTLTASSLLAITTLASAQVTWLPTDSNDLRSQALTENTRSLPASLHQEQAPVSLAWSANQASQRGLYAYRSNSSAPAPGPSASSQGYWVDVSGAELAQGVDLPLSAPGAVIRISALENGTELQLDPQTLVMTIDGRPVSASSGLQEFATGARMRSQGMPVPSDSLAFQLGRGSSAGLMRIQHAGLPSDQNLVIHVHEPNSEWVAELTLPRANLLSGEALAFDLQIGDARQSLQTRSVQAVLISPDASETWSLNQPRQGQLALNEAPMASRAAAGSGLYEARVYVEAEVNGITVRRDLSLALNIAPAIARFTGQVGLERSAGVVMDLGVETAAAGRYQVNAQLMGTNKEGQMQAIAVVQSAAVLDAGFGTIELAIDENLINSSGLSAPFEVHDLMLLDQGRMTLQEHRAKALRIAR
ncbi:MAG: DUF4785 domain-containing protein [Pseudomonadota bacterium]